MREAAIRSYRGDASPTSSATFTTILIGLAAVIAVGVVYNGARITLSERGRELASLRVLGFTRAEVAAMLLGEQAIIIGCWASPWGSSWDTASAGSSPRPIRTS